MEKKSNNRNKENKKEENKNSIKNINKINNKKVININQSQSYDDQIKDSSVLNSKNTNINSANEKEKDINNNHTADKNLKSFKLQEKLKKIFLEKEKAKYKYNKQIIPEKLKYNSDDEEFNYSEIKQESIKNVQLKKAETNPNIFNKNKKNNFNTNPINNDTQKQTDNKNNKKDEDTKNSSNNNNTINITENGEKNIKNKNNTNNPEDLNNINLKNNNKDKDNKDNKEIEDNRQKYYKLLNSKTIEDNKIEDKNKRMKKDNKQKELNNDKMNNNKNLENEKEIKEKKEKKESKDLDKINDKKIKSNRDMITVERNDNKKKLLKLLELIKSKKSEREIIVQKKDEIIKRSRSQAENKKKEEDNNIANKLRNTQKIEEKKQNQKDKEKDKEKSKKKKNNEIKPVVVQKIYKKNPTIRKINCSYKSHNYLTEANNTLIENSDKKITFSPLNINRVKKNNLTTENYKTNRFIFNNRLHNLNKKEHENSINKTENSFRNTFCQITNQINKTNKKYKKPKLSNNNIINKYCSTKYTDKSLYKNNNMSEYNTNTNDKYNESIICSPKQNEIRKVNRENSFTHVHRKNKLVGNNTNCFTKKNILLNENRDLSRSNYNIFGNYPNIHNYYNNSKIFLKNKFISIHPSFSIHNNVNINNNNDIDEININSKERNRDYILNNSNSRDIIIRNQKNKINKLGSVNTNVHSQGRYVYQKNKIKKNILKEKLLNDNESDISDNDKKNVINYEYLGIGTENVIYNKTLKNDNLNLADSYNNLANSYNNINPDNNTLFHQNENSTLGIDKFNQIHQKKTFKDNIFLSQSSPFYQRTVKKLNVNVSKFLSSNNYKRSRKINKNNSIFINIEIFLIFEEKFSEIVSHLNNNLSIIKPCLDFLNYYYNSWIYEKLEKIFKEKEDIEIVRIFSNYLLLSIVICYYISSKKDVINNNSDYILLEILEINYNSIMMIFQQIKDNVFADNQDNIFLPILIRIYNKYMKNSVYVDNNNSLIKNIYENNEKIDLKMKNILTIKKIEFFRTLSIFLTNLKRKNNKEIYDFFIQNVLNIFDEENLTGSLFSSHYYIDNDIYLDSVNPPFLKAPNKKKLTLILDLNDTLINFKKEDNGEGYVRIRPFLFGFLEELGKIYELIVFTNSEKEFADKVIEVIEGERTYFDYVFYRQHTIIVGNDFVKDLTRIGRPLNSTIIIDNMPQNFKLQKENGILIKPFWGEDSSDRSLYDLMPILLDIAKEGGDVRYALNKYRNEIIGKISSNIAKKFLYG